MSRTHARIAELAAILQEDVVDLRRLRQFAFSGLPDAASFLRSLTWKLLLGVLPPRRAEWPAALKKKRKQYAEFVQEFVVDVHKASEAADVIVDPLGALSTDSGQASTWDTFFKDNEVLEQIDKDVHRLCPEFAFYKELSPNRRPPHVQPLHNRVAREHLESVVMVDTRSGIPAALRRHVSEENCPDDAERHWEVVERILFVYAKLNARSYVQGMNEILGVLYFVFFQAATAPVRQAPAPARAPAPSESTLTSAPVSRPSSTPDLQASASVSEPAAAHDHDGSGDAAVMPVVSAPAAVAAASGTSATTELESPLADADPAAAFTVVTRSISPAPPAAVVSSATETSSPVSASEETGPLTATAATSTAAAATAAAAAAAAEARVRAATELEWASNVEADSFFCFMAIMAAPNFRECFLKSMDHTPAGVGARLAHLTRLLQIHDEPVEAKLSSLTIPPQFFAFRWITLLFTQDLALPDVVRLWDSLFSSDDMIEFVLYVCTAMVHHVRDTLLAADFAGVIKLLQNYPRDLDVAALLATADSMSQQDIHSLRHTEYIKK